MSLSSQCRSVAQLPTRGRRPGRRPTSPGRSRATRPKLECLEDRALLSTFAVVNLNDAGPGSLRQAILDANATPGRDAVTFAPAARGTISLSGSLPALSDDLDVAGPGASALTVRRSGGAAESLLKVNAGVTATLSGLTLAGGNSQGYGGGVSNSGTLAVTDCAFTGNQALFGGGAIFNDEAASLAVSGSTFAGNSTGGYGGGIYNFQGDLHVSRCAFAGNSADYAGGAIDSSEGTAEITRSTLTSNNARYAGGIEASGTTKVSYCTLTGNLASAGTGGGISSRGIMEVAHSTLWGNSAGRGAGLYKSGGTLTLTNCTIAGNMAGWSGGGLYLGNGGKVTVTNCTIAGNSASPTDGYGGGVVNESDTVFIRNTIVAGNSGRFGPEVSGDLASQGFNLIGAWDPGQASGLSASDRVGVDPQLAPLQDNGGPTPTMALRPGSPAVDAGTALGAPAVDQRGMPRDSRPDVGAYERDSVPPAAPVVTNPARPVAVRASSFVISGTAEAGSLVRVWLDRNNDGRINAGEALVAQVQLAPGSTSFSLVVPLQRRAANNFVVTATDRAGNQGAAADVPTITESSVAIFARVRWVAGRSYVAAVDAQTWQVRYTRAFSGRVYAWVQDVNNDGHQDLVVRYRQAGRWRTGAFSGLDGRVLFTL